MTKNVPMAALTALFAGVLLVPAVYSDDLEGAKKESGGRFLEQGGQGGVAGAESDGVTSDGLPREQITMTELQERKRKGVPLTFDEQEQLRKQELKQGLNKAVSAAGGAVVGGVVGGVIGGVLGSVVPVLGTAAGIAVGASAGAAIGAAIGWFKG